mgnify:CR=1 FL=1
MKKQHTKKVVQAAPTPKEEDLKYIYYFYRPQLVETLWKWELEEGDDKAEVRKPAIQVAAAGQYCYAVCEDSVYSWGMGENYVLGNRDDNNEFKPYKLDPRMFENNKVVMMGCGTQHAVALTLAGPDAIMPVLDQSKFAVTAEAVPEQKKQKSAQSEKKVAKNNGVTEAVTVVEEKPAEVVEAAPQIQEVAMQQEEEKPSSPGKLSVSKKRTHDEMEAGAIDKQHENDLEHSQNAVKRLKIEEPSHLSQ